MVAFRAPAPELAGTVELLWSVRGDGGPGTAFHEYFPDPSATLIVRLSPSGARAVLMGPATALATVERVAGAEYLGVRFRVGQTPALADVLPAELPDAHVELGGLGGLGLDDLAERLLAAPDLAGRLRLLQGLLRRAPPLTRSARARRLAALVDAHGGRLRVEAFADALGLHVRSLERLAGAELGIAPKRLARLVRLRGVLARLHAGEAGSLAALAADCGYADQAHLTRDLKALTGRLPGERGAVAPRRLDSLPRDGVVHRVRGA